MKKVLFLITAAICSFSTMAQEQIPAFPGAEGHGRYITGGRGGEVVHVTNLNDSGTGSLRDAVSKANRTVVFDVAGIIALKSDLTIKDNITIAGQTAPAPGITIRYYTVRPGANNIIRFIRIRRGQEMDLNDGADALWQRQKTGMMLDHCSFSWSIDEVASFYDNNNFTMQWCSIGESLVNAGHNKGAHGYGGIWGGKLASFHHNIILHVANRAPRFNGARYDWKGFTNNKLYDEYKWQNAVQAENVDFRNCVMYDSGNGCYGGPGGGYINMVNNYYKTGPSKKTSYITTASVANSTSSKGYETYWTMFSRYFINGNMLDGKEDVDWNKVQYDSGTKSKNGVRYTPDPNHYYGDTVSYVNIDGTDCVCMKLKEPAPIGEVTTHTAAQAYEKVLCYVGASLYRDVVDERYIDETRTGTALYKGSVTKTAGLIDLVSDQGTYELESTSRPIGFDSDGDGMPDDWEMANGLNPNSADDGNAYTLDSEKKWYTNIEVYINSLVEDIIKAGNTDAISGIDEYYPQYKTVNGIHTISTSINNTYYNLQGIRVDRPKKGIYIKNGRKNIVQ